MTRTAHRPRARSFGATAAGSPTATGGPVGGFIGEVPLQAAPCVAIISRDTSFREALCAALTESATLEESPAAQGDADAAGVAHARNDDCGVIDGEDASVFAAISGWHTDWRELEHVKAIVIDVPADIVEGLELLDVVRRRTPTTRVIMLCRMLERPIGGLAFARVGANLIFEGDVSPRTVADAVLDTRARRRA